MTAVQHAGYGEHDKISAIRYAHPELSDKGTTIHPKGCWTPVIDEHNVAYYTLFKPFNKANFMYPRPPIDMGLVDTAPFFKGRVNVLRMPIKFPGTDYKIPNELSFLLPLIERVADYESFINRDHEKVFAHITFDKSSVKRGEFHRFPGFHGDGFQGVKLTPKIMVEHSYIITTDPPTEFCLQPFFLNHLDDAKHNMFLEFDKQANKHNLYGTIPNHLYLIDPYMVHRTPVITKSVERIFVRITFTFSELDHPKNTMNPMFPPYQYKDRIDIRQGLAPFEFDVPMHLYGLTKSKET